MLEQLPFDLNLSHWENWAVPLVGLACAVVTLLAGRAVLRARRRFDPPTPKETRAQPDPFDFGSATERRSSLRRTGKQIKVMIARAEKKPEALEGWVVDRSMGGLCIALPRRVELDSTLSVRAATAPDNTPWVEVNVRRCCAIDDRWEVGCQFVRTPPWGVLLQFG